MFDIQPVFKFFLYIYYDYLLIVFEYVVVCVFDYVAHVEHSIRRFIDVIECNGVRVWLIRNWLGFLNGT